MKAITRIILCFILSFVLTEAPVINKVHAATHTGMIPTSQVVHDLTRTENQAKVLKFLDRNEVKNKLISMGISQEEASLRLASLSNSDLEQLSGEIDHATAGGDVIIWGLTVALLIILIIYLMKRI